MTLSSAKPMTCQECDRVFVRGGRRGRVSPMCPGCSIRIRKERRQTKEEVAANEQRAMKCAKRFKTRCLICGEVSRSDHLNRLGQCAECRR